MSESIVQNAKAGVPVELLERYCANHRTSFIASLLLCTMQAVALWAHVDTLNLLAWLALVLSTQAAQAWYAKRYLNERGALKYAVANWLPGLMLASLATGAAWGVSFFVLGLSGSNPIVILLIFSTAGVSAYAGISKATILPLGIAFEVAVLLPLSVWLFMQADILPHAQYMGIIALLYLTLLYFLLRQINTMALGAHSLRHENSELNEALATVRVLERESAMFRNMFEMIADPAIAVHDPQDDMRIVYANAAACRHFGVDEETVLTLRPGDFDVRMDDEKRALMQARLAQHGRFAFQSVHRRADGEEVPVEVMINMFEHEGATLGVTFVRNIAARLAAENRMQELELEAVREQEFRALAANLPVAVIRYNTDQQRIYVNPAAERMLHGDAQTLLGGLPGEGGVPATAEMIAHYRYGMAEVLANGEACELEFVLDALPQAQQEHFAIRFAQERDADGKISGVLAIWYDITERKRLEEQLRMKGHALDHSSEAMYLIDGQGSFAYVNEQACRALGYSREQLLTMGVADIDPDFKGEFIHERAGRLQEAGGSFVFETTHRRRDGSTFPVEIQVSELEFNGRVLGMTLARDISERQRAEQALVARERDFRSLAENMPDNVIRWDTEGRYLFVNPVHERTLEKSASELIGTMLPESHQHVRAALNQVVASRQASHAVRQSVLVNGIEELHDVSLVPEFDASGALVSVLGIGRNMTETYRMQESLAAREQEFRSLAESSPDYIIRYDIEHRILYLNNVLLKMLGLAGTEEVVGKRPIEVWPDGRFAQIDEAVAKAIASGEMQLIELAAPNETGELSYNHIYVVPERDAAGKIVGTLAFGRDISEIKRLAAVLQDRFDALQEAQRIAHIGSWDVDIANDVLTWSDETFRIWEIDREKFAATFAASLATVHPDDRERVTRVYNESIDNRTPYEVEHRLLFPDGRIKYILERGEPYFDEDGKPVRFVGTAMDITERKHLEIGLAAREQEFRSLAENSPDPIYRYDRACRRIFANTAVERLTGVPREAMLGKSPTEFVPVPSVDAAKAQAVIQSVLDSGERAELEVTFMAVHGQEVSIHNVFVPELDAAGAVQSVLCLGRDITEIKQAAQALAERQAFLDALFEAIPVPVFYKDREGRYQGINREFESVFGTSREQLIGKSVFDTHPRELAETYHAKDAEVFERRVALQQYEYQIKHAANGSLRDVLFSKAAFADSYGEVKGLIGAVIDITARKQAEIELQQRFDEIHQLNDSLESHARLLEEQAVEMEAAQEQIKQTEAWYRGILHSAPDGMMVIDRQGTITQINAEMARMFGYETHDLTGASMEVLLPSDLRGAHVAMRNGFLMASAAGEAPRMASNLRACRKDGSEFFVDVTLARLPESDYQSGKICAAVRDVTARKQAEIELQQRYEEIVELNDRLAENARTLEEQTVEMEYSQVQLKDALQFTEGVINAIPDILFEVDREGRYLNVWTQSPQVLAAQRAALLGKTVNELLEPESAAVAMAAIREADEQGFAYGHTISILQMNGERRWYEHSVAKKQGEASGEPTYIVLSRDVTERKQAEQVLDETRKRLHGVISTIPDLVWMKDAEGRYLSCNQAFEGFFGATEAEIVGKTDYDFVDAELADSFREKDRQAIEAGAICINEEWVTFAGDGRRVLLETRKVPVCAADGKMIGVLGVGRDITERKQIEEALAQREQEFRSLLENTPDVVVRYDRECRRLYVNPAWEVVNGLSRDDVIGKSPLEISSRILHQAGELEAMLNGVVAHGAQDEIELVWQDDNGDEVCFSMHATPEFDQHGRVTSVLTMARDISQRKFMERLLAAREQESRTLLENTPDTIARYDKDCRRLFVNPALANQVVGGEAALLGKTPTECPGGGNSNIYEEKLRGTFASGEGCEFELNWPNAEGGNICSLISLTPEVDEDGNVVTVLAVGRDITELNVFRDKIHQMAFYDPLTSLPNRALFNDRLRQMIADADWHGQTAGVMMIDMDRFKVVNDTMGHAVGDELLCETGVRLSACVRGYDTVARLGGDEFAILLPDVRNGDDLGGVADKLLEKFREPFLLEGKEVFVSCSIGIALYPDDSVDADDLLKFADSAMYYAKRSGRNSFRFYSGELTESANERLTMESELRRAVARGEMELHYQPKVDLLDGTMIGSEALLRWNHPQRGSVSPVKFIPVAEDSGMIVELGEWVLREACRTACEVNGEGRPLHKIAINLSARQFQSNDLVRTVAEILDETGCYPEWIELEITESLLLDEDGEVLETLNAFRALGISIAIDDFGTGYSSLSYLARFPITTLKIDRSFINTVTTDNFRAELVKAVLSIAKCLGQQVVAEGVETTAQAEFLQAHGCQIAQGYLFSKPQPKATFLALPGRFDLEAV